MVTAVNIPLDFFLYLVGNCITMLLFLVKIQDSLITVKLKCKLY